MQFSWRLTPMQYTMKTNRVIFIVNVTAQTPYCGLVCDVMWGYSLHKKLYILKVAV